MEIKFSEVLKHCAKMKKKIQSQRTIRHMTTHNKCRLGKSIELKNRLVIAKVGVKGENR